MPTPAQNSIFAAVALVAALGAGGVAVLTNLGSSACVPTTYTVDYTDNAFKVAGTTATKTLTTLANARQKLCMLNRDPQVAFTDVPLGIDGGPGSGTISAVTCSLGSATTSPDNSAIYAPALSVMQTTESYSSGGLWSGKDLATPDSNLSVVLTCKSTGGNFGSGSATTLTAGKIWITVGKMALPAGS